MSAREDVLSRRCDVPRRVAEKSLWAILMSGGGSDESISENIRRPEGALRHRGHTQLPMARRPTRSHGPHDQGERGGLPAGDGEGIQDGLAGIHLRDSGIGWRERGPEEPAERVDEAGRNTGATVPGQNRPQGDDLSRALRRGAYHRTVQRTFAPADPSGARGARGRKHLYSHAE